MWKGLAPMSSSDNYDDLAEALGTVIEQRKMLEAKEKELRALLDPIIGEKGTTVAGGFVFDYKQMAGRKTLDTDALKDAGIDLSAFYKVGKPYVTLSVKRVNS